MYKFSFLRLVFFVIVTSSLSYDVEAINDSPSPSILASYSFDSDLTDQAANYDGSIIGSTLSYGIEGDYNFASFGDDAVVSLPIELSENLFTDGSFEFNATFRKTEVKANSVVLFSISETTDAFWQTGGIKLVAGDSLIFTYNDGRDLDNYEWLDITALTVNQWYTVSLRIYINNATWILTVNDEIFKGTFGENQSMTAMVSIINNHSINFGGYAETKPHPFYGNFDLDSATFSSPAPSYSQEVRDAFSAMTMHVNGTTLLTEAKLEEHFKVINDNYLTVTFTDYQDELYAYTKAYETAYEPLYSDGVEYTFENLPVLGRTLQLAQSHIFDTQFTPDNVVDMDGVAFEHAEVAPGVVASDTLRIESAQIELNATYNIDIAAEIGDQSRIVRPTGYFLAAGDLVTITVPNEAVNKGLSFIVGHHFRNMDYDYINTINRFPDISNEFPLDSMTITLANPFGGGIYLKVPDGVDLGWLNFEISNAVKSPYFSWREGRETSVDDWLSQVTSSGAPWADFESDKFMFTIPVSYLAGITDPDEIMTRWDQIMDAVRIAGGRPLTRRRAEYYTFDTRLVTPAYGAGYPLVVDDQELTHETTQALGSFNPLKVFSYRPHVTLLHEMGHNHIHPTMKMGDQYSCHFIEAETVNHTLALASNFLVYDLSLDDAFKYTHGEDITSDEAAFDWIITNNFRSDLPMSFDESAPMEDQDMLKYQYRGWAKYKDIVKLFGFENGLGKVNGMFYQAGQAQTSEASIFECPDRPYIVGRDEYISAASEAMGVNMAPLFHFWGIVPSESLVAELASNYPASIEIANLIMHYRDNVAPKTQDDYLAFHNALYNKVGYQQPRYDEYITQFDETFAQQIQSQFTLLLNKYGFGDTDGDGIIDIEDGNPTVPNSAPVLTGTPALSVDEDSAYSFTPSMTDDGDTNTISFAVSNLPNWASFDTNTGSITGTPSNDDVGIIADIVISVSDGYLTAELASFNIEVININDAPTFTGTISDISVNTGENINQDIASYFSDIDAGDTLVFSASNLPSGVSISSVGLISGSSSAASTSSVTITATDAMGLSVNGALQMTISAAPVTLTPPSKESSGGGAVNLLNLFVFMVIFILRRKRVDC